MRTETPWTNDREVESSEWGGFYVDSDEVRKLEKSHHRLVVALKDIVAVLAFPGHADPVFAASQIVDKVTAEIEDLDAPAPEYIEERERDRRLDPKFSHGIDRS